jgi:hypothetical protein
MIKIADGIANIGDTVFLAIGSPYYKVASGKLKHYGKRNQLCCIMKDDGTGTIVKEEQLVNNVFFDEKKANMICKLSK